jgi:hypothetical protein
MDTLVPFINTRFIWAYTEQMGGCIDVMGEPPDLSVISRSPSLLAKGLFGYFFPHKGAGMIMTFKN